MPIQMPQWTEFLSCPICFNMFNEVQYRPISLACGHTVCKACLSKLQQKKCPFDQNPISRDVDELPVNFALLQLVGVAVPDIQEGVPTDSLAENLTHYNSGKKCIEELAIFLKPIPTDPTVAGASSSSASMLSRPMQRKLVTLVNCQLVEEEGRMRAMRAARSLGERTVTELILQHQNSQQLSANLWAAVRARGCQFLGPAMQEEVLRLILLALEDGSALSRKVLVLFVVQRLEAQYPQASKTAIGHVVQLLYRASCFKVTKREEESSLMQLKEEFCCYEALRREHDAQIVQIATEAGLRISPEQWSSLLYGDTTHKSHMQSIIDKLQTPQSFSQGVHELVIALQRTGDPGNLSRLRPHLDLLSSIDPSPDAPSPSWENLEAVMKAIKTVVQGLVEYIQSITVRKSEPAQLTNLKYRTSMCRDLIQKGSCPRGVNCTFAHSQDEMEKFRVRNRKFQRPSAAVTPVMKPPTSSALTPQEKATLSAVTRTAEAKLMDRSVSTVQSSPAKATGVGPRTILTGEKKNIANPRSFKVPVAKAMSLPMHHNHAENRKMIYTSPTVARCNQHPGIIPIARRAAAYNMGMVIENPYLNHLPEDLGHTSGSSMRSGTGSPPHLDSMTQANSLAQYQISSHASKPFRPQQQCFGSPVQNEVEMMTMTHNHQTNEYPNPMDQYVLYSSSRSKSPSQHLEVLQKRKTELLQQLNKSKRNSATQHRTSESEQAESSSYPTQMTTCRCTTVNTNTLAVVSPSVSQNISVTSQRQKLGGGVVEVSQVAQSHTLVTEQPATYVQSITRQQVTSSYGLTTSRPIHPQTSPAWSSGDASEERIVQALKQPVFFDDSSIPDEEDLEVDHMVLYDGGALGNAFGDVLNMDDFENQEPEDLFYAIAGPTDDEFEDEDEICALADDDEFMPFEHTRVSKYGPISRMARPSQTKNTAPLQVTASQRRDAIPVTAITPIGRPYPAFMEMPSQFAPGAYVEGPSLDHQPDTRGTAVAASLPTAHIRPSLLMAGSLSENRTMWSLKERMLNMPGSSDCKPAANSTAEREQIRHELAQLTKQIDHLEISEHKRLARELQAVEMNIQETERKMEILAEEDYLVAQKHQELEVAQAEEKYKQETNDRIMAQRLALEEAHKVSTA